MSELILYHGSDRVIEKPQFGKGSFFNDFGKGFYCTDDLDMAKEWACSSIKGGVINEYRIEIDALNILDLTSEEYSILNWAGLVLKNRSFDFNSSLAYQGRETLTTAFAPSVEGTDVIYGYRSDDSYFTFLEDFVNGTISLRELEVLMRLDGLAKQYVITSPNAFEKLTFNGYTMVDVDENKQKKIERDIQLRNIKEELSFEKVSMMDEIFILDILRS